MHAPAATPAPRSGSSARRDPGARCAAWRSSRVPFATTLPLQRAHTVPSVSPAPTPSPCPEFGNTLEPNPRPSNGTRLARKRLTRGEGCLTIRTLVRIRFEGRGSRGAAGASLHQQEPMPTQHTRRRVRREPGDRVGTPRQASPVDRRAPPSSRVGRTGHEATSNWAASDRRPNGATEPRHREPLPISRRQPATGRYGATSKHTAAPSSRARTERGRIGPGHGPHELRPASHNTPTPWVGRRPTTAQPTAAAAPYRPGRRGILRRTSPTGPTRRPPAARPALRAVPTLPRPRLRGAGPPCLGTPG